MKMNAYAPSLRCLCAAALLVPALGLAQAPAPAPLTTVTVQPHPVKLTFPADGLVEAVQQATVAAQIAGRVLEVRVDAGQTVKKGEVLMRLDAREASEQLAAAEAQYLNAKANFARQQNLVDKKFVSQAALDKARAELDAAAAGRSAAAAGQSHGSIVAPISGVVARRHAELGEMATPGRPLLTVYAPGGLRVVASIPQYRLKEIRQTTSAEVELPELGQWISSRSVQVLPTADAATHASQVRVNLPGTAELAAQLTPGMFARVHFITGEASKMTVPQSAVLHRGEVTAVYVQAEDGRLSLRQVRLGEALAQGEIEVLAGLAAGERVATEPQKALLQLKSTAKAANGGR